MNARTSGPRFLAPLVLALAGLIVFPFLPSCRSNRIPTQQERVAEMRSTLSPHLSVLGARNWIVIADPTYPILAGEGVDVITVDATTGEVFREVLDELESQGNLSPRIWVCSELEVVSESRAPGIRRYRRELRNLLTGRLHYEVTDHVISLQLAQAAQTYRILYIKTSTPLPYSSVAIELDSGYWNSDAEAEVRERIERAHAPKPSGLQPLPKPTTEEGTDWPDGAAS